MSESGHAEIRAHLLTTHFSRFAALGAINEDHGFHTAYDRSEFASELVAGQNLHFWRATGAEQFGGHLPSQAVVGAQRVAITQDQNARHDVSLQWGLRTSSSFSPEELYSWTTIGISPNAWVEQLRQGS